MDTLCPDEPLEALAPVPVLEAGLAEGKLHTFVN